MTSSPPFSEVIEMVRQDLRRNGWPEQIMWPIVGDTARSKVGKKPVGLSTAEGGVAWLHVRLDAFPKYYGYALYRTL